MRRFGFEKGRDGTARALGPIFELPDQITRYRRQGRQDTGGFEQSASFLPCTRGSGDPAQFTQSSAFDQQRFEPKPREILPAPVDFAAQFQCLGRRPGQEMRPRYGDRDNCKRMWRSD